MFAIKYVSSMFLILLGSMDCLTTVVGTLYFGTLELNPLIAWLVNTNLPAFVAIKLAVTVSAGCFLFWQKKPYLAARIRTTGHSKPHVGLLEFAAFS